MESIVLAEQVCFHREWPLQRCMYRIPDRAAEAKARVLPELNLERNVIPTKSIGSVRPAPDIDQPRLSVQRRSSMLPRASGVHHDIDKWHASKRAAWPHAGPEGLRQRDGAQRGEGAAGEDPAVLGRQWVECVDRWARTSTVGPERQQLAERPKPGGRYRGRESSPQIGARGGNLRCPNAEGVGSESRIQPVAGRHDEPRAVEIADGDRELAQCGVPPGDRVSPGSLAPEPRMAARRLPHS